MHQGEIPLRVRLGVTGRRGLVDEDVVERGIHDALTVLRRHLSPTGRTPIAFTVMSSLADGADQLAARAVLANGGDLEVLLPFEPDDYERALPSALSRQQFRRLLAGATSIERVPETQNRHAFEEAGEYIIDRADVLLAVHDPDHLDGADGPANIVAHARRRGVPTVVVDSRTGEISIELGRGDLREVARELENYNRPIRPATFAKISGIEGPRLLPEEGPPALNELADRLLPYFVRADLLALKYQARYNIIGTSVLCLAAAAVTSAATGAVFSSAELGWARVEVAFLVLVLAVFQYGVRQKVVPRWLWYRSLAERLRSAFYLAAAGLQGAPERLDVPMSLDNWVVRAGDEVWRALPRTARLPSAVLQTRVMLLSWIRGQIDYHNRVKRAHGRAHQRKTRCVWALVITVTVLAVVHASGWLDHHSPFSKWLSLLTIVLPAWGAAVAGSSELKAHRHYRERSAQMGASLAAVADVTERAETPEDLAKCALQADAVMRQDAEGWMGVMSVHDVPLPT